MTVLHNICDRFFDIISDIEGSLQNRMGYIYSLLSLLTGLAMNYNIKMLNKFPPWQLISTRGILGIMMLYPMMRMQDLSVVSNNHKHNRILYLRGLMGFLALPLIIFSTVILTIAENAVINMLTPPLVGILARFILGEPYTKKDFTIGSFCFIGVLCIVKPELFFIFGTSEQQNQEVSVSSGLLLLAQIAMFGSVVLGALTNIVMRQLGPYVHSTTITFSFCFFSGVMSLPGVIQSGKFATPVGGELSNIISYAVCGLLTQVFAARAYAFEKAAKVALVSYLNIILSYGMDVILFGADIGAHHIVGIVLIFTCFFINIYHDFKHVDRNRTSTVYSKRRNAYPLRNHSVIDLTFHSFHMKYKQNYGRFTSERIEHRDRSATLLELMPVKISGFAPKVENVDNS